MVLREECAHLLENRHALSQCVDLRWLLEDIDVGRGWMDGEVLVASCGTRGTHSGKDYGGDGARWLRMGSLDCGRFRLRSGSLKLRIRTGARA